MRPTPKSMFGALALTAVVTLGACGSGSTSSDTTPTETTATESTTAETPVAETTTVETTPPETTSPEPTVAEAPGETTVATANETVPGVTVAAAAGGDSATNDAAISALLMQLNGGVTPDPADIACVGGKISIADMTAMASAPSTDTSAFQKVFGAVFSCNPKGLKESFV